MDRKLSEALVESDLMAMQADLEFGKLPSSKVDGFGAEQTPAAVPTALTRHTGTTVQDKGDSSARHSRGYSSMDEAREEPLDNGHKQQEKLRSKLSLRKDAANAEQAWNLPGRVAQQMHYKIDQLQIQHGCQLLRNIAHYTLKTSV